MGEVKKILDVEVEIVESIIKLICRSYPKAIEATFYLEKNSRITNNITNLNVRDALFHFYNIFSEKRLNYDERKKQLINAEEHFRRAIIEPYELLADTAINRIHQLVPDYITEVVERKDELKLDPVFEIENIDKKLETIGSKVEKGRKSKNRSIWDDNWQEAIILFNEAHSDARAIVNHMELLIKTSKSAKQAELREQNKKLIEELKLKVTSNSWKFAVIGAFIGYIISKIDGLLF